MTSQTTLPHRQRDKSLNVRLGKHELDKFNIQFKKSHQKGKAEFLMRLLKECPIIVINDIVPLRSDLKRIGTNINQCAKALNRYAYEHEIDKNILVELNNSNKELNVVLQKIQEVI